jgi:hypothetical protein
MQHVGGIAVPTALWIALVAADVAQPSRTIDLNAPGALETLQQSRPAHYEKVRKILEGVSRQPDRQVTQWMRVSFGAHSVDYPLVIRSSFPAQRRLSFVLDDTRYRGWIWLTDQPFRISPAGVPASTPP